MVNEDEEQEFKIEQVYQIGELSQKKLHVQLMVEGRIMSIQMDTGASCNVISEEDLKLTRFRLKRIKHSNAILKTYDRTKLNMIGRA